jgi:uncharacterized protein YbaR (Trm112 family)
MDEETSVTWYDVPIKDGPNSWTVTKRYSQFETMYNTHWKHFDALGLEFPGKIYIPMSPHSEPQLIIRAQQLREFMNGTLEMPMPRGLRDDLYDFLQVEQQRGMFFSPERGALSPSTGAAMYDGFICPDCKMDCPTIDALLEHSIKAHGGAKEGFICPECQQVFPAADALEIHLTAAHGGEGFICPECKHKCSSANDLMTHT